MKRPQRFYSRILGWIVADLADFPENPKIGDTFKLDIGSSKDDCEEMSFVYEQLYEQPEWFLTGEGEGPSLRRLT